MHSDLLRRHVGVAVDRALLVGVGQHVVVPVQVRLCTRPTCGSSSADNVEAEGRCGGAFYLVLVVLRVVVPRVVEHVAPLPEHVIQALTTIKELKQLLYYLFKLKQ